MLEGFEGIELDAEASAAIEAALEACAARARAAGAAVGEEGADHAEADPDEPFVSLPHNGTEFRASLEPATGVEEWVPYQDDEGPWQQAGADLPDWATPEALAAIAEAAAGEDEPG